MGGSLARRRQRREIRINLGFREGSEVGKYRGIVSEMDRQAQLGRSKLYEEVLIRFAITVHAGCNPHRSNVTPVVMSYCDNFYLLVVCN